MRAMAELGSTEQKASDVAGVLGKALEQIAPLRARLISKGLLYTPRYGYAKFTVPQFDRFMRRYMDRSAVPLPAHLVAFCANEKGACPMVRTPPHERCA
jgi:hypothetical protein